MIYNILHLQTRPRKFSVSMITSYINFLFFCWNIPQNCKSSHVIACRKYMVGCAKRNIFVFFLDFYWRTCNLIRVWSPMFESYFQIYKFIFSTHMKCCYFVARKTFCIVCISYKYYWIQKNNANNFINLLLFSKKYNCITFENGKNTCCSDNFE